MLAQNDWINGDSDSSDTENANGDVSEELRRSTLVELVEKRAAYRAADRHGGREHPYQLALIRELGIRLGVLCHRVECLLRPGHICGLAFHRFVISKQGTCFANLQHWQRAAIEQAVAASTKLPSSFRLAFDIDQHAGFEHWAYLAQCNCDATMHAIHITNIRLPRPPGRLASRTKSGLGLEPARRALATLSNNSIPVVVTAEHQRLPRRKDMEDNARSANIAIRLLNVANPAAVEEEMD